jgi:diguanylate cyclase (GGDEF)-like protein
MMSRLTRPSIARAAILPVAGVLVAIAGLAVAFLASQNRMRLTAGLVEKAALTARVAAPNAAAATWQLDRDAALRVLQSLASDQDFASGIIIDDKGAVFARFDRAFSSIEPVTPEMAVNLAGASDARNLRPAFQREFVREKEAVAISPLVVEEARKAYAGTMVLAFSRARVDGAARQEVVETATIATFSLLAICTLLAWILSRVTRPIRELTGAMNRLSAGEHDTLIPALSRRDEIGAMARALSVLKENSIERQRLEFLTRSLQRTTEDLRREGEKVAWLAHHDMMTGFANRASFNASLGEAFAHARDGGACFAVLCLDIDHFKDVNDTLGHAQGDMLLQAVARRLEAVVRETDVVGRLGGDEFAILLMSEVEACGVASVARRINKTIAEPFAIGGNEVHVSASIGISVYSPETASPASMMIQADLALYRIKESGRNSFCFHSPDLDRQVRERVALTGELHAALQRGELAMHYQPQVEIASGRVVGLEALMRWNHPQRGLLAPGAFLHIAETTGMIMPLGRWILEECCRQMQCWNAEGIAPPLMAINISRAHFKTSPHLDRELGDLLARYGVDAGSVELELTEQALMEAADSQDGLVEKIRALGVGIAIDDFGMGHSSLRCLHAGRVSRIKIAQQLMREVATSSGDATIVRATIGLARELNIDLVAEGIETAQQLRMLKAAGCRCAQGYYFSRPLPAAEIEAVLRRGVLSPDGEGRAGEDQSGDVKGGTRVA